MGEKEFKSLRKKFPICVLYLFTNTFCPFKSSAIKKMGQVTTSPQARGTMPLISSWLTAKLKTPPLKEWRARIQSERSTEGREAERKGGEERSTEEKKGCSFVRWRRATAAKPQWGPVGGLIGQQERGASEPLVG